MAVYSTLIYLQKHMEQLLDTDQSPLSNQKPQIQSFHRTIRSLQASVDAIFPAPESETKTANTLEIEIIHAAYQAQDDVEDFVSGKIAFLSLQELAGKFVPIKAKAEKLADSIRKGRERDLYGDISPSRPRSGLVSRTTRILGQELYKQRLMHGLLSEEDKLQILPITGMAGVGKTTLARSVYDDPQVKASFLFRGWVTVYQDYRVGDILSRLLNSMEIKGQKEEDRVFEGSDDQFKVHLHKKLYNHKYLVVIDDVSESSVLSSMMESLPDNENGSRIILITRYQSLASYYASKFLLSRKSYFYLKMWPISEKNSWILLCDKAFGGMMCPPHLEKIGKRISENCRGLPLSLSVIGGLLSQGPKTEEYWRSIGEGTIAAASEDENTYLNILYLSYNQLPGILKGCFLYLGAFPEESDIPLSKLSKLLVAEGFLVMNPRHERMENVVEEHLVDLSKRNLVTVRKISSDGRIKACGLNGSLRNIAVQESRRQKFFHCVKSNKQEIEEDMQMQRRLSIHRNILISMKEVYQFTKTIKYARTLLYVGPHHHHPMPFCLTFDLLRVLDAFTIYFIEFPDEFLKLIHLRYLSLTYNDDIPPNISLLQELQVLMVRREPKLIFVGVSFLPDEIWEMPELRHLWFTETDFPALPLKYARLHNLQSLSYINASSCTREVLRSMHDLKKIGMWVERPGVVGLYLDELVHLKAFKFTVLNPSPNQQVKFQPVIFFPSTLKKLSLSGCGLPWEDMKVIAGLPNLEVLKLRELAFSGTEWCLNYVFEKLKFLLIEYLTFKQWIADNSHFPNLEQLILRHCYELEGIPEDIGYIGGLQVIELVDCSRGAVESAKDIEQEQEVFDKQGFQVRIYCSYEQTLLKSDPSIIKKHKV